MNMVCVIPIFTINPRQIQPSRWKLSVVPHTDRETTERGETGHFTINAKRTKIITNVLMQTIVIK